MYLLLGLGEQQLRMKHTVLLLLDRTLGLQMAPLLVQLVDGAASISYPVQHVLDLGSHVFVLPAQGKNIR